MLTYTFGLISPDAVTTDVRSSRTTLPVCTVTTPLRVCCTVKPTIASRTSTPPAIRAIFFQFFIVPQSGEPVTWDALPPAAWYALRRPKVPLESSGLQRFWRLTDPG